MSWEDKVRKVVPYTPGEQPAGEGIVKLNTNENPYPPSPEAAKALEAMGSERFRLYPDPEVTALREAIAKEYGVGMENVFVGVGSDDVIAMCFMAFFNDPERPVLFPDISYSFYPVWADMLKIPYRTCPLTGDLRIRKEDYDAENGGVIFPNPNAPTGIALPYEDVRYIVENNRDSVVIVDEAYVDFGAESALPLIDEFDNLLVIRTFSKSRSGAGLRIGYAFGSEKLIKYLSDVKYSFNSYTMNYPSIVLGTAVMKDRKYFEECVAKIISERERTIKRFREAGYFCTDSKANFVFVSHPVMKAHDIFTALKEKKIYVRWFGIPGIDNYLRVTIGTPEEMDILFNALSEITGES